LLAHGRWFSPGTPTSSTTKTGRHDIAEILLKVALKHQKSKSKNLMTCRFVEEHLDVLNRINDPAGEINIAPHFKSAEFLLDLSVVLRTLFVLKHRRCQESRHYNEIKYMTK
jgi:hypothetical protein